VKKRLALFILVVLLLVTAITTSCGQKGEGRAATVPTNPPPSPSVINRIISTAPSNTEIIAGLGFGDRIVAIDSYSRDVEGINPAAVAIDFTNPDAEVVINLEPDIIITSEHNRTNAGGDPFVLIRETGIPVALIPTSVSIDGLYSTIVRVAEILGVSERGEELVRTMQEEIKAIAEKGRTIEQKKTVYFEISPAPYLISFGGDTFLNEMLELVGAQNIFADISGWIAPGAEAVITKNPDVILTNVNYLDDPVREIKEREGFGNISAVIQKKIYVIDTNSSSRPSQHILLALTQMARSVYPEVYGDVYEKQD
jgi:iron complex transport system substrate-binding protein